MQERRLRHCDTLEGRDRGEESGDLATALRGGSRAFDGACLVVRRSQAPATTMDEYESDDDSEGGMPIELCSVFWKLLYNSTSIEPLQKARPAPE